MDPQDLRTQHEAFSWLPDEGLETLGACFHLETEHLEPGDKRDSRGRVAWLLQGRARTADGSIISADTLLGLSVTDRGEKKCAPFSLEAAEPCDVLWFDFELLRMVCYAACWFHVRFLKEIDRLLEK